MADNNNTLIQLPLDILDPLQLRRFLDKLSQQVDIVYNKRKVGVFPQASNATISILNLDIDTSVNTTYNSNFGIITSIVDDNSELETDIQNISNTLDSVIEALKESNIIT